MTEIAKLIVVVLALIPIGFFIIGSLIMCFMDTRGNADD